MSCEEASSSSSSLPVAQPGLGAPSAGEQSAPQDTTSLTPPESTENVVQPFPRSPQLQRRLAKAALPTQEQLSKKVEELRAEKAKTEARIQSLKKRRADLAVRTEVMKQQIHARFEAMRAVLKQDEQAAAETLEVDLKRTRAMLDQVLKTWSQHLDQVTKTMSSTQKALKDNPKAAPGGDMEGKKENVSLKKSDGAERNIRLNEERFEKLVQMLSSVCKQLRVQLQRKTLLLDLLPVSVDAQTCHPQLSVTSEGTGLFYGAACSSPEQRPLQFDRVCCALGSTPLSSGQGYWEVDVRCCSGWAVGVAYARLERKGRDKGAKLGRNRNSWCVEFKNGKLSAWHNDRHVACQQRQARVKTVGVWVHFEKGRLVFYDAETMGVLQSFSAAMTPVFDRAHHQFTEPLFPAVRFIKPDAQAWPNHMEFCCSPLSL